MLSKIPIAAPGGGDLFEGRLFGILEAGTMDEFVVVEVVTTLMVVSPSWDSISSLLRLGDVPPLVVNFGDTTDDDEEDKVLFPEMELLRCSLSLARCPVSRWGGDDGGDAGGDDLMTIFSTFSVVASLLFALYAFVILILTLRNSLLAPFVTVTVSLQASSAELFLPSFAAGTRIFVTVVALLKSRM